MENNIEKIKLRIERWAPTSKSTMLPQFILKKDALEIIRDLEADLRELENNPENWITENLPKIAEKYGYDSENQVCYENIIQYFLKQEILGE
jgi:hypothetical protein